MKKIMFSIWPTLVWVAIVFYLLSMPTDGIDTDGLFDFFGADKVVHLFLFFVLGILCTIHISNNYKEATMLTYWILVCVMAGYGLGMEYYQKYFTSRNFSMFDALFDAIGAVLGMLAAKKSPYGNRGRNQN